MLRLLRCAGTAALLLAAACGSRSSLATRSSRTFADGSGGSGGAGGSSATTSTGAGGDGGAQRGCSALAQHLAPLEIVTEPGRMSTSPQLVTSSVDGRRVTVVYEAASTDPPGQTTVETRHVSLEPWDAWPAITNLGPGFYASAAYAPSSAVGRSDPAWGDFAMLFHYDVSAAPTGVLFSPEMSAEGDFKGFYAVADANATRAAFIARSGDQWLLGHESLDPGAAVMRRELAMSRGIETPEEPVTLGRTPLGCSTASMSASAVPSKGGWMIAYASSASEAGVGCAPDGNATPPAFVHLARVRADGSIEPDVLTQASNSPRSDVRLAAGPTTTWLATTNMDGSISVARVGDDLSLERLDPGTFQGSSIAPGSLAVDTLGDALVVGWIDQAPDARTPSLVVSVIGADLSVTSTSYATGVDRGTVTVLGSPDGRSLLAGYTDFTSDGLRSARVLRFDCVSGL